MVGWRRVRESFWFLPAVLCTLGGVLAEVLVAIDRRVLPNQLGVFEFFVYTVGANGSREVLGTIAGSMLAVASTTFSITIAVLAVTSSTYGPRLVRNFMADRANQLVLGVYLATFLYALLVLRSIRTIEGTPGNEAFVPHLSVNVAVLLALLGIGVLVYFIHHISDSIQVSTLSHRVRTDLNLVIDRLYPRDVGRGESDDKEHLPPAGAARDVRSVAVGYVVHVNGDELMSVAARANLVVQLHVRPGVYCVDGTQVASVWPASTPDDVVDAVRDCVALGDTRTPHQDIEFAAQQLIEMAVRALSPSTNDPYTALNALDDLSGCLTTLFQRNMPPSVRLDEHGNPRVHAQTVDRGRLVEMLFVSMRTYALDHPQLLQHVVEVALRIGRPADSALRERISDELELLLEAYAASEPLSVDLVRLRDSVHDATATLRAPTPL